MKTEKYEPKIESEEVKSSKQKNTIFNKPDNVADFPNLIPYPTNVGSPQIKPDNVDFWKQKNLIKVNKIFSTEFNELKEKYNHLIDTFKWNDLIYNSKFSFEPVIGEIYFLYQKKDGELFLSIV